MRIYEIIDVLVLCQLCFTGLAAVTPDVSILHTFNLTSASSGTPSQSLGSNSVRPPDPFSYQVPQSSQVVTFSRYSRTLEREDVLACLLSAALQVIKEVNQGPGGQINTKEIQARSGHALLIFHPDPSLTWRMWGTTLIGINSFFNYFEFVDCNFMIEIRGLSGTFGSGLLGYL
ncbi:hypothetical protein BDR22DRAFT_816681 [Usnea florida]